MHLSLLLLGTKGYPPNRSRGNLTLPEPPNVPRPSLPKQQMRLPFRVSRPAPPAELQARGGGVDGRVRGRAVPQEPAPEGGRRRRRVQGTRGQWMFLETRWIWVVFSAVCIWCDVKGFIVKKCRMIIISESMIVGGNSQPST